MKVLAHAGPAAWLLRTIDDIPLIGAADRPSAAFFFLYARAIFAPARLRPHKAILAELPKLLKGPVFFQRRALSCAQLQENC
ncbi:hypothetical protein [Massilia eburnea]|uniref:hypothetical protein n=1 Tax=Massilia eburnea TaxID=1776165 RepID=UPI0014785159|nr:hypothetical protein [Massilia eburnea]